MPRTAKRAAVILGATCLTLLPVSPECIRDLLLLGSTAGLFHFTACLSPITPTGNVGSPSYEQSSQQRQDNVMAAPGASITVTQEAAASRPAAHPP